MTNCVGIGHASKLEAAARSTKEGRIKFTHEDSEKIEEEPTNIEESHMKKGIGGEETHWIDYDTDCKNKTDTLSGPEDTSRKKHASECQSANPTFVLLFNCLLVTNTLVHTN